MDLPFQAAIWRGELWLEEMEEAEHNEDYERLQNLEEWEEKALGGVTNHINDPVLKQKVIDLKKKHGL